MGVGRSMNRLSLINNSYYEPQGGQLLAASFMDYAMPRSGTLPFFATALSEAAKCLRLRTGSVCAPGARAARRRRWLQ